MVEEQRLGRCVGDQLTYILFSHHPPISQITHHPQRTWLLLMRRESGEVILGVFAWFWSDADKTFQTPSREQIGAVKKGNEFQAHGNYPLSMSSVSKGRKSCAACFATTKRPMKWPLNSKRPIASLDILIGWDFQRTNYHSLAREGFSEAKSICELDLNAWRSQANISCQQ